MRVYNNAGEWTNKKGPMEATQREDSATLFYLDTNRILVSKGYETISMDSFYEVLMGGAFFDKMQAKTYLTGCFTSRDWPMIMADQIIHQGCWTRQRRDGMENRNPHPHDVTVVDKPAVWDPNTDPNLAKRMQVPAPAHGHVDIDMDSIDMRIIPRRHDGQRRPVERSPRATIRPLQQRLERESL